MVEVLSKKSCVQCTATKRMMDNGGVEYVEINVEESPEAAERAKSYGYMSAPVVVVKDAQGAVQAHWSGFRPELIKGLI